MGVLIASASTLAMRVVINYHYSIFDILVGHDKNLLKRKEKVQKKMTMMRMMMRMMTLLIRIFQLMKMMNLDQI